MEVRYSNRTLGVLQDDGRIQLSAELRAAPPDDPWVLWTTVLGNQTAVRRPRSTRELEDCSRDARTELLPAVAFADAYRREPDRRALAEILGLPVEVLEDRLRDMDVALLTAQPLRGRTKG